MTIENKLRAVLVTKTLAVPTKSLRGFGKKVDPPQQN